MLVETWIQKWVAYLERREKIYLVRNSLDSFAQKISIGSLLDKLHSVLKLIFVPFTIVETPVDNVHYISG